MKIDIDKWLGYLSRFLNIIRPKTYNVIARVVVGVGATLVISQTHIVEAVVVAVFESYFGRSDVLRDYLSQESNLHWGAWLIAGGLIYHLLMTVGTDLVDVRLQRLPKHPTLTLGVLNADSEDIGSNCIQMRGSLCVVPPDDDIPEHVEVIRIPMERTGFNMFGGGLAAAFLNESLNAKFFKERASFLRAWGGAELLCFTINNVSPILAKNVSVCFVVSREAGVAMDNTNDYSPAIPSAKKVNCINFLSSSTTAETYDIKRGHTDQDYIFTWNVGDVQAGTIVESKTAVFIRTDRGTEIHATIYCDDLPEPVSEKYQVRAPIKEATQITTTDLKLDDAEFVNILDNVVMDGYLRRRAEKEFKKYQHESQEYLPQ